MTGVILAGEASLPQDGSPGDLAVAAIPAASGDLREIQRQMLTVLIDQRSALMERGVRIHARLSQMEAEGRGLQGLAQAMSEISSKGVLIQDKRGRILAEFPAAELLSIWEDLLKQLDALESLPEALIDRKRAGLQGTVVPQSLPSGQERLIAPMIVGEIARGYLSLVGLSGDYRVFVTWQPNKWVGLGLGYNSFTVDVDIDKDRFNGSRGWTYSGPVAFYSFAF